MQAVGDYRIKLKSVGSGVGVAVLAFLAQLVAFFVTGMVFEQFLQMDSAGPVATFLFGDVIVRGLTSGLVAATVLAWQGDGREYVGIRKPSQRDALWTVGIGLLVVGVVVGGALFVIARSVIDYLYVFNGFGFLSTDPIWLAIPLCVIVVGPGIELLFRGVVQSRFREGLGPVLAVLGSTLVLMMIWRMTWLGDPQSIEKWVATSGVLVFVPLLLIGIAYERTENIIVPAVLHGLYLSALFVVTTVVNPYHIF